MTEPQQRTDVSQPMRRLNPHLLILLGGVLILVLLLAYYASTRNPDQDKLKDAQVSETKAGGSAEKRCASQATYDLIKRELFRRAALMRGSDQAAYDKLSAYAVVRMENPVLESENGDTGAVNCSGSLSLDLPPGVAVVGGRHSLNADIDYTLQGAADGSGTVVLLRNADAVIAPLATLARTAQQEPPSTETASEGNEAATAEPTTVEPPQAPATPEAPGRPAME